MSKLKFSWDVNNVTSINTSYEKSRELVQKPFSAANIFNYISLLENIKSGDLLPQVDFTPSFVAGGCGYADAGTLDASDMPITTKLLKSDKSLCQNDLVGGSWERYLPKGVNMEDLGDLQVALETFMIAKYAKAIQNMALTGVTGANSIDGLITLAYASADVDDVEGTAPTSTDALDKLFAIYEAMPSEVLSSEMNPIIMVGTDWLRMAALQSYNDNRTAYNFTIDAQNGFTLPTTNVRVQAFDALDYSQNGNKYQALAGSSNMMYVGTDMKDDMASFKMWWSEDDQIIKSTLRFRIGTALRFQTLMRRYKVTA